MFTEFRLKNLPISAVKRSIRQTNQSRNTFIAYEFQSERILFRVRPIAFV